MYTGTSSHSGTNSGISMEVWGTEGHMGPKGLGGGFENGDVDTTNFYGYFGKPYRIKVYHDGSGMFSGWQLNRVTLQVFDETVC